MPMKFDEYSLSLTDHLILCLRYAFRRLRLTYMWGLRRLARRWTCGARS